jgi:hypothetical protein
MKLKRLLNRFKLQNNGKWRKGIAVTGPKSYFWFNPDLNGCKTWIVWNKLSNDYIVQIETVPSQPAHPFI